jgi:hypothetical protein
MPLTDVSEFVQLSYSRRGHFASFETFEQRHIGDIDTFDLKVYQDLLVYNFIKRNIKKGSRILEVGGGESRVIEALKSEYEFWNLDKLEGFGFGPIGIQEQAGYRIVRDYIGNFNASLPDGSFDLVFSISALEHVPEEAEWFEDIMLDIDRLLKPGGYSLHCFDVIWRKDGVWSNELLYYMYGRAPVLNPLIPWSEVTADPDLYVKSRSAYDALWRPLTNQTYEEFGRPFSYNLLWQKPTVANNSPGSTAGTHVSMDRLMKNMQEFPRITIVTPSFNQGEFLEECIDSVLGQNYPNLEYIVMDGGSSDNSVAIIKKYEKHIAFWQSKPDDGQYYAINEGFRRGTGDFMAWLNSDDKYHAGALMKVAGVLHERADVEWLTGRPTAWGPDGKLALVEQELVSWTREKLLARRPDDPFVQQESTFWRRSLWEKAGAGLRTEYHLAADHELWLRFSRFAQLFTVDALLGGYRYQKDQKAKVQRTEYLAEVEKVLQEERRQPADKMKSFPAAPTPLRISSSPAVVEGKSPGWSSEQTVRSLSELSARQLGELRTKEKMIKDLNVALDERMKLIQSLNSSLDERIQLIESLNSSLEERGRLIEDLSRSLDDRAQIIESLKRIADERAAAMEEKERVIQLINQELETIKSHWTYRFASRLKRLFNFRRAKRD